MRECAAGAGGLGPDPQPEPEPEASPAPAAAEDPEPGARPAGPVTPKERLALRMPWGQQINLPDERDLILGRSTEQFHAHPNAVAAEQNRVGMPAFTGTSRAICTSRT